MPRKVTVKQHRRKGKRVKAHRRKIKNKISKRRRKVFTALAKENFETGGQLDFEKGKLDNARLHFGDNSVIEFPADPDFETTWHTHPPTKGSSVFPSTHDILDMRGNKEKEGVIFNKKLAISISEAGKFQRVPREKIKRVMHRVDEDFNDGMSDEKLVRKYKPILKRELGLNINLHKPGKAIKLQTFSR